jgi:hypothetical protein
MPNHLVVVLSLRLLLLVAAVALSLLSPLLSLLSLRRQLLGPRLLLLILLILLILSTGLLRELHPKRRVMFKTRKWLDGRPVRRLCNKRGSKVTIRPFQATAHPLFQSRLV